MTSPIIAVFAGGTSGEREVSLGSGRACAVALARSFPTRLFEINADALPAGLDPAVHVVFSTLHGTFGEDGGMQRLLDGAHVHYAGCDAASSALTMDKTITKQTCATRGVATIPGLVFPAQKKPTTDEVIAKLGEKVVVKPNDQGSSIGLRIVGTRREVDEALAAITTGNWLIERRIFGRELAIGVLDYESKYTKGKTEYFAPAPMSAELTERAQRLAEASFAACGCRDYARVDFMLEEPDRLYLLEINTLPGMKETSLLPMSARCAGRDFTELVRAMVAPACARFRAQASSLRK
jgi:D-alanine-D-alanine ligase